jgi:hypothetical protein
MAVHGAASWGLEIAASVEVAAGVFPGGGILVSMT